MQEDFQSRISDNLQNIELKIKNSFGLIKKDISSVYSKVDLMRDYLNSWDKSIESAWKKEEMIRETLTKDVNDFAKRLSQLKLALSSVKSIKNELVVVRDLTKIEERIKESFKEEIKSHRDEIIRLNNRVLNLNERLKTLEKSKQRKESKANKKGWSFKSNFNLN